MTAALALFVTTLALLQGAPPSGSPTTRPGVDPAAVAAAQGRSKIPAGTVFHGKLTVQFGDSKLLDDAEIWFKPSGAVVRLEAGDATAVADGKTAWISPPDAKLPRPRFQLYTWPYFAMAPFKLDDAGVKLEPMEPLAMTDPDRGEITLKRAKMTFTAGTGDAPDDWYVLYVEPDGRLGAMAYIVTYGKTKQQAEAEPHAILYGDVIDVPGPDGKPTGVRLSTSWSFRNWSPDKGMADSVGSATIAGLELIAPPADLFDVPADAREVPAPE